MLNELYPVSKQNKFTFLVQQSQLDLVKTIHVPAILTNTVISGALSTGQRNYSKKLTDDGRTTFAYHLHNLYHH